MKSLYVAFGFVALGLLSHSSSVAQQQNQQTPQTGNQQYQPSAQAQQYQQALQQQRQQAQAAAPQMPAGFPLAPETQKYVEELLGYWENYSDQVNQYHCEFTRWEYDRDLCSYRKPDTQQLVAALISKGVVRYANPDQGMYEISEKWQFNAPPEEPGGETQYERPSVLNPEFSENEKWICNGSSIYEYDYQTKRLYELALPPEAQGEGLKNSPLPFVFGAKAQELLERFWIRDVTPKQLHGQQYWLEAWPKQASDAQVYQKVEIILSADPFLPMAIHMFLPNYDEKTNPSRVVFQFEERKINGVGQAFADNFMGVFISPRTPFGWKRVKKDLTNNVPEDGQRLGQAPAEGNSQGR